METGTQNSNNIDYDWLPKETTTEFGKLQNPNAKNNSYFSVSGDISRTYQASISESCTQSSMWYKNQRSTEVH